MPSEPTQRGVIDRSSREPPAGVRSPKRCAALRNARRLLRLVNQLLDFQKLQARKLELKSEPIELGRFMTVCTDYVLSFASSRSIEFALTLDGLPLREDSRGDNSEVFIHGDVDALEKITFNFLSNA